MDQKIIVALDAMGGDLAPVETVKGAVDAVKEMNVLVKLVGREEDVNRELAVLFKVNQNTAARIYREMESMGLCYTKRGIGTFVSEEDDMISGLKKEMAEELVRNFMQEMEDLGFQKGDIIDRIADYKEEEK